MRINVIEKATGIEFVAEQINGGYQLFTMDGEKYKKLRTAAVEENFTFKNDTDPQLNSSQPEEETDNFDTAEDISEEKRKKLIDKIKKMFSLSENNPSKEEALSAALQAQKLMAKYNIHKDEVTLEEIKDEIDSVFSDQPHDFRLRKWRKTLALIVSRAFRCKTYLNGLDIVFRGYKTDAQIALEVYLALYSAGHEYAKKIATKHRTMTGTAKGIYNSVIIGYLKGVEDALNEQCRALMIITPKEVEEEYAQFTQGFKKAHTTLKSSDAKAYQDGYREGKSVASNYKMKRLEAE